MVPLYQPPPPSLHDKANILVKRVIHSVAETVEHAAEKMHDAIHHHTTHDDADDNDDDSDSEASIQLGHMGSGKVLDTRSQPRWTHKLDSMIKTRKRQSNFSQSHHNELERRAPSAGTRGSLSIDKALQQGRPEEAFAMSYSSELIIKTEDETITGLAKARDLLSQSCHSKIETNEKRRFTMASPIRRSKVVEVNKPKRRSHSVAAKEGVNDPDETDHQATAIIKRSSRTHHIIRRLGPSRKTEPSAEKQQNDRSRSSVKRRSKPDLENSSTSITKEDTSETQEGSSTSFGKPDREVKRRSAKSSGHRARSPARQNGVSDRVETAQHRRSTSLPRDDEGIEKRQRAASKKNPFKASVMGSSGEAQSLGKSKAPSTVNIDDKAGIKETQQCTKSMNGPDAQRKRGSTKTAGRGSLTNTTSNGSNRGETAEKRRHSVSKEGTSSQTKDIVLQSRDKELETDVLRLSPKSPRKVVDPETKRNSKTTKKGEVTGRLQDDGSKSENKKGSKSLGPGEKTQTGSSERCGSSEMAAKVDSPKLTKPNAKDAKKKVLRKDPSLSKEQRHPSNKLASPDMQATSPRRHSSPKRPSRLDPKSLHDKQSSVDDRTGGRDRDLAHRRRTHSVPHKKIPSDSKNMSPTRRRVSAGPEVHHARAD